MDKGKLLGHLNGLDDREFAEFFYASVEKRSAHKSTRGIKWVLAQAHWEPDEIAGADYKTYFVSPDDKEHYGGDIDWAGDICQFGSCRTCKKPTASWAKFQICAICNSKTYGT